MDSRTQKSKCGCFECRPANKELLQISFDFVNTIVNVINSKVRQAFDCSGEKKLDHQYICAKNFLNAIASFRTIFCESGIVGSDRKSLHYYWSHFKFSLIQTPTERTHILPTSALLEIELPFSSLGSSHFLPHLICERARCSPIQAWSGIMFEM